MLLRIIYLGEVIEMNIFFNKFFFLLGYIIVEGYLYCDLNFLFVDFRNGIDLTYFF